MTHLRAFPRSSRRGIAGIALLLLAAVLLTSGCSAPSDPEGPPPPEGFRFLSRDPADKGVSVAEYIGAGSGDVILDRFSDWMTGEGWTQRDDTDLYAMGPLAGGLAYERGNEGALLQLISVNEQATARLAVGPLSQLTRQERDGDPETDAPGKDLTAVPRYPGSIRTEYFRNDEYIMVRYDAKASLTEVRDFYLTELEDAAFNNVDAMEEKDIVLVQGFTETYGILVEASEDPDRTGLSHIEISRFVGSE